PRPFTSRHRCLESTQRKSLTLSAMTQPASCHYVQKESFDCYSAFCRNPNSDTLPKVMRHASLSPLSKDHHHGLALALRCRKQALGQIKPMGAEGLRERAKEFLAFYAKNLVSHFRAEEEVLFP